MLPQLRDGSAWGDHDGPRRPGSLGGLGLSRHRLEARVAGAGSWRGGGARPGGDELAVWDVFYLYSFRTLHDVIFHSVHE